MARQHATPILLGKDRAETLVPLPQTAGEGAVSEADIQALVHAFPACLPINEVDPLFASPVPVCRELNTRAGAVDNLLITPTGLPVLVECKLWRNPEGRREAVGQILDYAKELSRWSASDLQREVARRVQGEGNPLLNLLRDAGHVVDEIAFNDALTHNLRRGRFLLLIIGDGIREGVEAIAEYLQIHAGLHFSFGLIEMPIFTMPSGDRLVVPRVLARTELITRTVVAVPDGQMVLDSVHAVAEQSDDQDPVSRINFWTDFVRGLTLDDPEQPKPRPGRQGYVTMPLPVPGGECWLVSYRSEPRSEVGVYLSFTRDSIGARVVQRLMEDWPSIQEELGGDVALEVDRSTGRQLIQDSIVTGAWTIPSERERALTWLRRRTNEFVNVLRPRVKEAAAELAGDA